MKKRVKLGRKHSKRMFSRTAMKFHPKNGGMSVLRGGIRL